MLQIVAFLYLNILQGIAVMPLRGFGIFKKIFIANLPMNLAVQEF